jgi:predicted DCC family thiol-disulfide oxidoreductase YuxK
MGKSFSNFVNMADQPVILFDGVCNFCNGAVNFAIKRDKKAILKFATLQSGMASQLLDKFSLSAVDLNSFVLIENGKVYTRSTAALKVFQYLDGLWPLMYGFIIVPKFLRDVVYKLIAKNRYRWFGIREKCMIPTPEVRSRFLNK